MLLRGFYFILLLLVFCSLDRAFAQSWPLPSEPLMRAKVQSELREGQKPPVELRFLEELSSHTLGRWYLSLSSETRRDQRQIDRVLLGLSDAKLAKILEDISRSEIGKQIIRRIAKDSPNRMARLALFVRESPHDAPLGREGYQAIHLLDSLVEKNWITEVVNMRQTRRFEFNTELFDQVVDLIEKNENEPEYAEIIRRRMKWRMDNPGKAHLLETPGLHRLLRSDLDLGFTQSEFLPEASQTKDPHFSLSDNQLFLADRRIRRPIGVASARSDSILLVINDKSSDRAAISIFDTRVNLEEAIDQALASFRNSRRFHDLEVEVVASQNPAMHSRLNEISERLRLEGLSKIELFPVEDGLRAHAVYIRPSSGFIFRDPEQGKSFEQEFYINDSPSSRNQTLPQIVGTEYNLDFSTMKVSYPQGFADLDLDRNRQIDLDDLAKADSERVRELLDRSEWTYVEGEFFVHLLIRMDAFRVARILLGEFENTEIKAGILRVLYRENPKKFLKMVLSVQELNSSRSKAEGINAYRLIRHLEARDQAELLQEVKNTGQEGYATNIEIQLQSGGQAETEPSREPIQINPKPKRSLPDVGNWIELPRHQLTPGRVARKNGTRSSSPVEMRLGGKEGAIAVLVSDEERGLHYLALIDREIKFNDVFDILFYEMKKDSFRIQQSKAQILGGSDEDLELVGAIEQRLRDQGIREIDGDYGNLSKSEDRIIFLNLHSAEFRELEDRDKYKQTPEGRKPYGIVVSSTSSTMDYKPVRPSLRAQCLRLVKGVARLLTPSSRKP